MKKCDIPITESGEVDLALLRTNPVFKTEFHTIDDESMLCEIWLNLNSYEQANSPAAQVYNVFEHSVDIQNLCIQNAYYYHIDRFMLM